MTAVSTVEPDALLLELIATPEGRADPYPRYAALRERAPVHRSAFLLRDPVVVSPAAPPVVVPPAGPHSGNGPGRARPAAACDVAQGRSAPVSRSKPAEAPTLHRCPGRVTRYAFTMIRQRYTIAFDPSL
jgi:hypothetical protein